MADLIGLDVCLAILQTLHEGFGEPKYGPCPLLVRMVEAGGGGYGDPRERDTQKVLEDVRQGFVSPEGALRDYGVKVELEKGRAERV